MAIQLAKAAGANVYTTAGTPEKVEFCRSLGADVAINYRLEDFVEILQRAGGADVVLDNMGAKYLSRNVAALAPEGRLVIIGMQGGVRGELNIAELLNKRAAVVATSLRSRPIADKAAICSALVEEVWPLFASGQVRPIIGSQYPLVDIASAHEAIDSATSTGKVLVTVA
ncbi:MAG TPA: zinc-binding dehydrogenase, partial [Marmoricola sp.]|nr:zinc-binding dehydrogenase [Marmoricola sp.]